MNKSMIIKIAALFLFLIGSYQIATAGNDSHGKGNDTHAPAGGAALGEDITNDAGADATNDIRR